MVLPSCVGNLQKGERYVVLSFSLIHRLMLYRYANMDYIFGMAIRNASPNTPVVISYNIACHWFTNLRTRMNSHWPKELLPTSQLEMRPQIPPFHEPGHGQVGHQEYSFKLSLGMGLTDREGCERIWAANNALGNATKTQGPGSRQDVIDDHLGFWNWLKYCGMGRHFFKSIIPLLIVWYRQSFDEKIYNCDPSKERSGRRPSWLHWHAPQRAGVGVGEDV